MKKYPFYEIFETAEYLNWFRIFKYTEPQLFINKILKYVDLSSSDSISDNKHDRKFHCKVLKHIIFVINNLFGIARYKPSKFFP